MGGGVKHSTFLLIAIGVVLGHSPVASQQTNSPVTLTLRIAGDRNQFRPGEIIPIELEFRSSIPGRFVLDNATYDRSGRLRLDDYRIEPNDQVTDPMLDYFAASPGFVGGGVRGMPILDRTPVVVEQALNHFFRFDQPGHYTLSVLSRRVTDRSAPNAGREVPLTSNAVSFDVVQRDAAFEEAQLRFALDLLASSRPASPKQEACRLLRFLASDAAVDQMIAHFHDGEPGCQFEFTTGFFAAPDRTRTVRRLEEGLLTSPSPVSRTYLNTLAILSVYLQHPDFIPVQTRDTKGGMPASGELSRHQDLIQAEEAKYASRVASLDPASGFLQLTPQRQRALLESEWDRVAVPAMIPVLRGLADTGSTEVADLALRRLYELAPQTARPLMLRNIANPPPGATLLTLGMLPESELSDLDEALVVNLESGGSLRAESTHAELVHRYASRTVARRVFEYLEPRIGRMPCRPQAALLAYALRVDESRGSDFLDRALKDRQSTGCYQIVLSDVARLKMTPVVLSEAAAHINDSSIEVVVSAVEAMGRDRGPSSRGLLLERFRRWHDAWQGRENELQFDPLVVRRGMSEGMIELTLLRVLSQGQLDAREIAELQSLCVTATCRADAGRLGK